MHVSKRQFVNLAALPISRSMYGRQDESVKKLCRKSRTPCLMPTGKKRFQKKDGFCKILLQFGYKLPFGQKEKSPMSRDGLMRPDTGQGRYHAPGPASRAAKKFPRFRRAWETFLLSAPLQPLTANSDCAHGRQPKSPRPISAGRHVFILEPGYVPEEGTGHDTDV